MRPCVAAEDGERCVAALLYGVPCCLDRSCIDCRDERAWMRRSGYASSQIDAHRLRHVARRRVCPVCGCSAPDPLDVRPEMPSLERDDATLPRLRSCRVCARALGGSQRVFCSRTCRLEWRRVTEGWGARSELRESPSCDRLSECP